MIKKGKVNLGLKHILVAAVPFLFIFAGLAATPKFASVNYQAPELPPEVAENNLAELPLLPEKPKIIITHIQTPEAVKGVYMTSYAAGTASFRERIFGLLKETELNSIIIDITDYSGRISFRVQDPLLVKFGASENRIPDIVEFIATLHEMNVYVIGRITVFQNPYIAKANPKWAVKKKTDQNQIWKDKKGLNFIDPGAQEYWDYIVALSRESYGLGFDEFNYDYIRFPSDGDMKDIYYPWSHDRIKADVLEEFFAYLSEQLRPEGIITSADLFGMTMTNVDDLNIGQILERTAPHFDFIAPMVYPSHWPKGWNGFSSPATMPYEVVKISLEKGAERLRAMGEDPLKLRPWIQDFNLGATYTAAMVRKQIEATYDAGLTSWMLWDPKNIYTKAALEN